MSSCCTQTVEIDVVLIKDDEMSLSSSLVVVVVVVVVHLTLSPSSLTFSFVTGVLSTRTDVIGLLLIFIDPVSCSFSLALIVILCSVSKSSLLLLSFNDVEDLLLFMNRITKAMTMLKAVMAPKNIPTFTSIKEEEELFVTVDVPPVLLEVALGESDDDGGEEVDDDDVGDEDGDDDTPELERAIAPLTSSVSTLKNPPTSEFVKTGVAAIPNTVIGSAFSLSTFSTSSSSPNTGGGMS